jgi:hypothetical protein
MLLLKCKVSWSISLIHWWVMLSWSRKPGWPKIKVMFLPNVCLGVRHPSGAHDQIFNTVRQLRFWWREAPSLARGQVCSLQLLLGLAWAVVLGSESRGTQAHILITQTWDSPTWSNRFPYVCPLWTAWSSYTPRNWVSFSPPLMTRRATTEAIEPAPHGDLEGLDGIPGPQGVTQGFVLYPTLHSILTYDTCFLSTSLLYQYIWNSYVLRKLQRDLTAIGTWCELWNIKFNEGKAQAIYFSHIFRPLRFILHGMDGISPSSMM